MGVSSNLAVFRPSPNQAFLPASLFGLAAGTVISNNIYVLKGLACDFYYLIAHHQAPPMEGDACAAPQVEEVLGILTLVHAVLAALLGVVGLRIMRPCLVTNGRKWGFFSVGLAGTIFCVSIGFSQYVQGLHKLFFITFAFVVGAIFSETLAAMAGENMILDLSGPDNRATYYTIFQGLLRGSASLGATIGGFAATYFASIVAPYWLAACFFGMLALWSIFLPDSLSEERRQELLEEDAPKNLDTPTQEMPAPTLSGENVRRDMRRCFRGSEVLRPLVLFLPKRVERGRRRWALAFAAAGLILLMLGVTCQTPLLLLLMSNQLKFKQGKTGVALTVLLGSTAVYLLVLLPALSSWIKGRLLRRQEGHLAQRGAGAGEHTPLLSDNQDPGIQAKVHTSNAFDLGISIVSILIYAAAFLLLAVTHDTRTLSIAITLLVLSSGAQPNLTAYMASLVQPSETDTLNAAISIMQNLMAVASPIIFLGLYSLTVKKAPAVTFIVLAICMLVSAMLLLFKIQRPAPLLSA